MKSPIYGLVFLIYIIHLEFTQAETNADSLANMAYSSSDVSDYDYDDGDDIDIIEKEPLGKRNRAPAGAWGKRGNQPLGAWGKRSAQPPGAWGKRSNGLGDRSYHEKRAETKGDGGRFAAFLLRDIGKQEDLKAIKRYKNHLLERRKLALIDSLRKLKETLDDKK